MGPVLLAENVTDFTLVLENSIKNHKIRLFI